MAPRRARAILLLAAGWLLPAAWATAVLLHELEHAHDRGVPRAAVAIFHGHLHAADEPPHRHVTAQAGPAVRAAAPVLAAARAWGVVVAAGSPLRFVAPLAWRDDPDPGGPSRQASLSVFRV